MIIFNLDVHCHCCSAFRLKWIHEPKSTAVGHLNSTLEWSVDPEAQNKGLQRLAKEEWREWHTEVARSKFLFHSHYGPNPRTQKWCGLIRTSTSASSSSISGWSVSSSRNGSSPHRSTTTTTPYSCPRSRSYSYSSTGPLLLLLLLTLSRTSTTSATKGYQVRWGVIKECWPICIYM